MSEYQELQEMVNEKATERQAAADAIAKQANANQVTRTAATRRKATKRVAGRLLICAVIWLTMLVAVLFNLIHLALAVTIAAGSMVWASYWLGAWVQYMYCKGGLLNVWTE